MLHELNVNKACGPDSMSSHVLQECATELAPSLAHLFTRSFQSGCIPVQWKQGNVVPVHKKGDKSQVSNHRPISLLCILSKVMEKYIITILLIPLSRYTSVAPGFMNVKSCTTQLLKVYENVGKW